MASLPAKAREGWRLKRPSVIPGFGLTLGLSITYLTLLILIPLATLILRSLDVGPAGFWRLITDERTLRALETSFGTAVIAALINVVFGTILAWVLVRYRFMGRQFIDAIVDIPFALPTAVAGIALASIYAPNGWIGSLLSPFDIRIAFSRAGIVVALVFIGLPFVVRTVQPIIEEISQEVEEAAATLGATRFQTISRVLLPALQPAILTGFALAFARGIGEYGSVIFIAGNTPYVTEIAPLLIVIKLEEYDYAGATALATIMLLMSFGMLFIINLFQSWSRRRYVDGQ